MSERYTYGSMLSLLLWVAGACAMAHRRLDWVVVFGTCWLLLEPDG